MNLFSKGKKLLVLSLAFSLLLSGCPEEGAEQTPTNSGTNGTATNSSADNANKKEYTPQIGKYGGKRVITSFSPPKTFNIYLAAETSSTDILSQMYLGLVTTDPMTTDVIPSLAESWTISDDNLTYEFKLREGLKWSDGQPLTADDVVFTYNEVINNPDIPNNYRDGILIDNQFPKVEKIDDLNVRFVTPKPFVPFLRSLADPIVPKHILANLTKKDRSGKVQYNQWGSLNSDPKSIVSNGPFKLEQYVAGQRVILSPNPHYYKKNSEDGNLPYVTNFVTEIVKDQEVETIKFKAGETDALWVRGKDYEALKPDEEKLKYTIHNLGADSGTLFVMFNMSTAKSDKGVPVIESHKSKWFRNVKFRQAMAHAVDKQSIIRSVYRGLAIPQISHVTMQSPFYNPNVKVYDYNLDTAAKVLEEGGFKKNDKGELIDADGKRVEFDLVTNVGNAARDATCAIIRADWEKLGIKVNYRPIQFNVMVQQIDETLDWDAMMIGLTGSAIEPHSGINVWRPDGRMHMFNMGNELQSDNWKGRGTSTMEWEQEVLDLYLKAAEEFDPAKRKELYFKSQEIVAENLPFIYTVNSTALVAVRNNIGNIFPSIHGGSNLNTVNWNADEHFLSDL